MILSDQTFRRLIACLVVVGLVLVGVVALALRNESRSVAAAAWVNHTHAVRAEAADILSALNAAEAALRTHLLTGDPRDQSDYRVAFAELAEHVEVAKALTRQEPAASAVIAGLEDLLAGRADLARKLLQVRQEGSAEELRRLIAEDAGSEGIQAIGRLIENFRQEQAELLTERDHAAFLQAQTTRWTVLTALLLDMMLLTGAVWLIRDDLRARQRAAAVLQEANDRLEARVSERTAELTAANAALHARSLEDRWARLALEHQLRYNHLIIDCIAELVIIVTKSLNVSRVNPAVEHLAGCVAAELVDRPLDALVRLAGPSEADDPLLRALKDGRDLRDRPALLTTGTGPEQAMLLSLFPLRDGDKVVGGVVTLRVQPRNLT